MADLETASTILADLVAFPSVSLKPNRDIASYIADRLTPSGFDVHLDPDPSGERVNVIASIGPQVAGGIVLSGHLDVVPASPERWQGDPFRLRQDGDRLIGRGAVDMKGFVAACLAWAADLAEDAGKLRHPVHFVFTFDEEVGSFGAAQVGAFLKAHVPQPAIAIVGEPTEMRPIGAHRGILELTTTVRGSAGHASDPRGRVNAVACAARMVAELHRRADVLAAEPDPNTPFAPSWTTISVGRIAGGEARNVIPDRCVFDWEIRPLPGVDGRAFLQDVRAWAENLEAEMQAVSADAGIETTLVADCKALVWRDASPAADLIAQLWTNAKPEAVSFATDAGYFQEAGIDTVVFGPGSLSQMHQPEEHITLSELSDGLRFLERLQAHLSR